MTGLTTGLTYVDRRFQKFKELEVAQTLKVLAAVDWAGVHKTVETYVGLWEVCTNDTLLQEMTPWCDSVDSGQMHALLTLFYTRRKRTPSTDAYTYFSSAASSNPQIPTMMKTSRPTRETSMATYRTAIPLVRPLQSFRNPSESLGRESGTILCTI